MQMLNCAELPSSSHDHIFQLLRGRERALSWSTAIQVMKSIFSGASQQRNSWQTLNQQMHEALQLRARHQNAYLVITNVVRH